MMEPGVPRQSASDTASTRGFSGRSTGRFRRLENTCWFRELSTQMEQSSLRPRKDKRRLPAGVKIMRNGLGPLLSTSRLKRGYMKRKFGVLFLSAVFVLCANVAWAQELKV